MRKAISILGPTHCGKSELAIEVNRLFPSKIISVDSVQVYKSANIGSSKPEKEILNKIHHGLINILELEDDFSVNDFLKNVSEELSEPSKNPLFVGGTMMYFYSLFNGISKLPKKKISLRKKIESEAKKVGWGQMYSNLKEIDPQAAESIEPSDSQRILRALEVNKQSDISFSDLKKIKRKSIIEDYQKFTFALVPRCKKKFKNKLKERFMKMLDLGLVEETSKIMSKGNGTTIKVLKTVGYKQVVDFLSKKISYEEMIELATNATYQLSKRQITWLKKFKIDATIYTDEDDKVMKILSIIEN